MTQATQGLSVEAADVVFTSGFGGRIRNTAVNDLTMVVGEGRPAITAVVGESGSGKSTLIRMLLGFQSPTRGRVLYDGADLAKLGSAEKLKFRREVQAIFQDPFEVFNPFHKVDHPLLSPMRHFGMAKGRDESYALIEKVLESVGLTPSQTLGRYPHQLSGGQRQRVMIARALLLDPRIILADEPVSMVDASLRSTILDILYDMHRSRGISFIYVTHDLATAYQVAETIIVLHRGRAVEIGPADAVIHDPRHAYTRALISAIPSPDPDVPWDLEAAEADRIPPPGNDEVLVRIAPGRAISGAPSLGPVATVAQIQREVAALDQSAPARD